jgi:hypothetical protein
MAIAAEVEALEARIGDGLAELITAAERELAELHRQRGKLDEQIASYGRKLRTWESVRGSLGTKPRRLQVVADNEPTKREAVLAYLAEQPEAAFRLVEIRKGLIARGWMTSERRAIHALEVAVSGMADRGEIHRVRKGIYRLRIGKGGSGDPMSSDDD